MASLWDTSVASRLRPDGQPMAYVGDQHAAGTPVRVAAPAVLEIAYGYQRVASVDDRATALLSWFARLVADDVVSVVPMDGRAAVVAGRVRGVLPYPPPRPKDRRSRSMGQAAWILDIQIAATAFAAGLDVATRNREDFEVLRDALVDLFAGAPPLLVLDAPI